jgi:hypothetical protein
MAAVHQHSYQIRVIRVGPIAPQLARAHVAVGGRDELWREGDLDLGDARALQRDNLPR